MKIPNHLNLIEYKFTLENGSEMTIHSKSDSDVLIDLYFLLGPIEESGIIFVKRDSKIIWKKHD